MRAPPPEAPDSALFRAVFENEFAYVWRSLQRLGVPPRDVEDVTHDVFLQVFRRFHLYDRSRPVRPWLFAFAFRMASDYRRSSRHRHEVFDAVTDRTGLDRSALDRLVDREALALGQAALETMDIARRSVFILHQLDGCPIPEVARVLELPLNTAYSRLRSARMQFDEAVQRLRRTRG